MDDRNLRTLALYRRLLTYAVRRWPALTGVATTMLLDIGMQLLKPWPMALVVDSVLGDERLPRFLATLPGAGSKQGVLTWAVLATVVVFALEWLLSTAGSVASINFGERMQYDLAGDLLRHLQRLSLRYHDRHGAGDLLRRITTDSGCVSTIVRGGLLPAVTAVVGLASVLVVMLRIDPVLTLVALAVLPVLALAIGRLAAPMAERSYEQQEVEGRLYEVVEESLSGIVTVQAFGAEPVGDRRMRDTAAAALRATIATTVVQFRFKILVGTTTALGTAAVTYLAARHALDGQLSVGEILVFLAYLSSLYSPLESLMYTSSTLQGAAGSAARVVEILDSRPEVADPEQPQAGALSGRVRGLLELRGVGFEYEPGRPVVRGVSFAARPGELVALVGATGAGKSTLAALVMRLFDPQSGAVLLDGVDARLVPVAVWRSQVALVLQESFLFPVSIADNIAYGRPGASREQVMAASVAANADEFVRELPEGYDTVVGERGATLSGGQRQRVAIARALLKDAPVLVLDEPTSALDARTEGLLLGALDVLMAGRTTVVIAHRLSTIRRADRIVVLEHGRVVESGSHDELVAAGGTYATLHALQTDPAGVRG